MESTEKPKNPILVLETVARVIRESGIEGILFGNAAAFLRGAPVTPKDLDFVVNEFDFTKFVKVALILDGDLHELSYMKEGPYAKDNHPWRIFGKKPLVQVDFVDKVSGSFSFEDLKSRGADFEIGSEKVFVASLKDVIDIKRAAGRPKDLDAVALFEKVLANEHLTAHPQGAVLYECHTSDPEVIQKIGYVRTPTSLAITIRDDGRVVITTEGSVNPIEARILLAKCKEIGIK
jgi:hypothetical protein